MSWRDRLIFSLAFIAAMMALYMLGYYVARGHLPPVF